TGGGHFSPVGGFHAASDHALILDVARFKYPPHWVPVPALYAAMEASDEATARPRGWIALRRSGRPASLLFTARCVGERGFAAFAESLARLGAALAAGPAVDLQAVLRGMFEAIAAELPVVIEHRALAQSEHVAAAEAL